MLLIGRQPRLQALGEARPIAFDESIILVFLLIGFVRQSLAREHGECEAIAAKANDFLIQSDRCLAVEPFGQRRLRCFPPAELDMDASELNARVEV